MTTTNNLRYRIGVDLGGTNIAAGIVADNGTIFAKSSVRFVLGCSQQELADSIAAQCRNLVAGAGLGMEQIEGIGIGAPGLLDPPRGLILRAFNLGLENMSVSHLVGRVLNKSVRLANDANCAALGEAAYGAAKNTRHSVTVTLGTGIGGGIIIDGKIYDGAFFSAGELHQVIRADGELCTCGRRGCWEAYVSAGALVRQAVQASGGANFTAKMVFEAAEANVPWAVQVVGTYLDNLAIGLGNIVNILQPEVVVLGGGMAGYGKPLLDGLAARMPSHVFNGDVQTRFVLAKLGNDAGIVGAALLHTDLQS